MKPSPFSKSKSRHSKYETEDGYINHDLIRHQDEYDFLYWASKAKTLGLVDSIRDAKDWTFDDFLFNRELIEQLEKDQLVDLANTINRAVFGDSGKSQEAGDEFGGAPPF
ncbi:hypothetical protein [Secundilactobacillus kimchicus]|uniref:hypothetical protein n=1 Tax=Secundilactobacillus kimchicus TaxID=528209 RepID=UPI0024A863B2|nr:hypothetical protein [Secundilactobacillus kimchicus]